MSATRPRLCPICKKPRDHAYALQDGTVQESPFAPFCSERCRDRDLARWFNDGYAVPGEPANPEDFAREE